MTHMETVSFRAGTVVFDEGDAAESAYRIREGSVEISQGNSGADRVVLAELGEGEIFGEMGLVEGRPRSARARAKTAVELDVLGKETVIRFLGDASGGAGPLIGQLFRRLRAGNNRLRVALEDPGSLPFTGEMANTAALLEGRESVWIEPESGNARAQSALEPREITKFPYLIGRRSEVAGAPGDGQNDLLVGDEMPYRVSREHCAIEREGGRFYVRDRGSRMGCVVNGLVIGGNAGAMRAPLQPGENTLVLGVAARGMRFRVVVPEAGER